MSSAARTLPSAGPRRAIVLAAGVVMALVIALLAATPAHANTLDGVWHNPYGNDELYATQPTE